MSRDSRFASIQLLTIRDPGGPLPSPARALDHWTYLSADALPEGVGHAATGFAYLFGAGSAMQALKATEGQAPLERIFSLTRWQLRPWHILRRVPIKDHKTAIEFVTDTEIEAIRIAVANWELEHGAGERAGQFGRFAIQREINAYQEQAARPIYYALFFYVAAMITTATLIPMVWWIAAYLATSGIVGLALTVLCGPFLAPLARFSKLAELSRETRGV